MPPVELRALIGSTDPALFDNPDGDPVFRHLPVAAYRSVVDMGCGCGRVARMLLQQDPRPQRYIGFDLHAGMIDWCQRNLAQPGFDFLHHDIQNLGFNPDGRHRTLPIPAETRSATLVNAWSVFTHLMQDQATHYLHESSRVLTDDGYLNSTWFLFEKADFPMMQDFQNALFINDLDPTNAVIFDREWLIRTIHEAGLKITYIEPPGIRGYQWLIVARLKHASDAEVEWPVDAAPAGRMPPPLRGADAHLLDGR